MNRHLRRVIQENNYGTMMRFGATDTTLGKTLFQFRNFVTTAYAKQLQHGLQCLILLFVEILHHQQ